MCSLEIPTPILLCSRFFLSTFCVVVSLLDGFSLGGGGAGQASQGKACTSQERASRVSHAETYQEWFGVKLRNSKMGIFRRSGEVKVPVSCLLTCLASGTV